MPTLHLALTALLLVAWGAAIAQPRRPLAGWWLAALVGASLPLWVPELGPLRLDPDWARTLGLPPLLFAAAWQLEGRLARVHLGAVLLLASLGAVISLATIGSFLFYLSPLSLVDSLRLGAALAATSSVTLRLAWQAVGTPRYLPALLAGESALNQGLAVVGFSAIASLTTREGLAFTTWQPWLADWVTSSLGGGLLGIVGGLLLPLGLRATKRQPYGQGTLSLVVVWLVAGLAEYWQVSGAIAVVCLGLVGGWQAATQLSPSNREVLAQTWASLAYTLSTLICLLAGWGAIASLGSLDAWFVLIWLLAVILLAGSLARALAVYLLVPLVNALRQVTPLDWRVQTLWLGGGPRSPIALVLLLSLPPASETPQSLLLALALGTLLLSSSLAATSFAPLARYLELAQPRLALRVERLQALRTAKREALQQFADLERFKPWAGVALTTLAQDYRRTLQQLDQGLVALWGDRRLPVYDRHQALWLQALTLEAMGYRYLYDCGLLSEPVLAKLELRVTLRRDAVLQGSMPPPFITLRSTPDWLRGTVRWLLPPLDAWLSQQGDLAKYEANAALACVCAQVAQTLERSLADGSLEAVITRDCVAAYQEDSEIAARQLVSAASQDPQQVRHYQQQLGQRIATLGEQDALEQLVRDGALNARLAQQLGAGETGEV